MAKTRLTSSSSTTIDLENDDFPTQGVLKRPHSGDSHLTQEDIPRIKALLGLGDDVVIHIPKPGQKADAFRSGWICLYTYPFVLGLKFPFPPMIQEFIRLNSLPMAQIAPYAWRILLSTVALNNSMGAEIGLSDLAHRFECRSLGHGQYTFRSVEKTENFLLSAAKGKDDGWYEDFFYIKLESLPIRADYLFEHWIFAKNDSALRKPCLLGKHPSIPWNSLSPLILYSDPLRPCAPVGSAKPSASEILMRHARKRTADSSHSPASSRRRSSSRPAPEPIEATPISRAPGSPIHSDELLLRLPAEFGDADRANYWPALERLLTPACSKAFDSTAPQEMTDLAAEHCFLALQSSLYLRKMLQRAKVECLASVGKNKELTATCAKLREQLHTAFQEKEAAKDQLARTQEANCVLTSGLTKAEARAEEMAELAKNVGAYTAFEGRIDCIRAYTEGKHTSWNLEEELAEFARAFPNGMDLSALFPPEAEAANPEPEYSAMDISGAISGTVEEILAGEAGDGASTTPGAVQVPAMEKQIEHGEQSNGQEAAIERIDLS
ncbi:uncharacterized protein LOC141649379 [Silene latifolia]|uniref:uncharacterized protein LOC141649379 n=1 Tax=Silene latifolia TaxID=37657 RepID=UPI003D77B6AF